MKRKTIKVNELNAASIEAYSSDKKHWVSIGTVNGKYILDVLATVENIKKEKDHMRRSEQLHRQHIEGIMPRTKGKLHKKEESHSPEEEITEFNDTKESIPPEEGKPETGTAGEVEPKRTESVRDKLEGFKIKKRI